ncbi:MAG TPA: phosphoribosylformylglycinamidine cyclo-ligase [Vicinamibacteria bacterium]|nr:phosphoribosylformylglycinamidine cyclo-ligase [Vicinamibacteria bacterium]
MDYREAGVDISAADAAKARIKALARATFNPAVLSEIGSFGGMFRPDLAAYREPVLVASTDGVGTKIQVARAMGVHDTVGYDLVAHCVNDILVQGAVPLFFLDYIALGTMDPERVERIVAGFARGCSEFGCPLLGGETAEMPGTYAPDDYDLAGFIVGIVEKERALTGQAVREGDVLLGLPSSGLHTNGYSLARKALFEAAGLTVETHLPELGTTVGRALLAPHRGYLAALEPLLERGKIRALAHITGGGFPANIPRVLPRGLAARVRTSSWPVPPLFRLIRAAGKVPEEEMYRTFNMGVGMVVVVAPGELHEVEHSLERRGETSHVIGHVEPGAGVILE